MSLQVKPVIRSFSLLSSASLAALLIASPVTASAAEPIAAQDPAQVAEIVVTARRVSERLQDIPASVNAVSGDALDRVSSLQDIGKLVPGLTFQTQGPVPAVGMRGYGNRPSATGANTGLGFYQDGVFIPPFAVSQSASIDVERIEVAKGPQSTLYGRSSLIGAVNIVTPDPAKSFGGYIEAGAGGSSAGDEKLYNAKLMVEGPLTHDGALSARLAVIRQKRDGYLYDPVTGYRAQGYDRTGARLKLMWEPTSDLTIRLSGSVLYDKAPPGQEFNQRLLPPLGWGVPQQNPTASPAVQAAARLFHDDIYQTNFVRRPTSKAKGAEATLDIRYESPIGEFTSITNYMKQKLVSVTSADLSPLGLVDLWGNPDEKRASQEFRLNGEAGKLSYMAGAYFLYSDYKLYGGSLDRDIPFAVTYPGSALYDLNRVAQIFQPSDTKTRSKSVFAQLGYDFTDSLNITAGLRQSQDYVSGTAAAYFLLTTGAFVTPLPPYWRGREFNATTGNIVATYKIREDLLAYASFARGDSPGGLNYGTSAAAVSFIFAPQEVDAYEVGLKGQFLDRRLQLNVALYNNDYTNLQLLQTVLVGGVTTQVISNAGKSYGRGVDLSATAVLNRNWQASLSYTHTKSRITDYTIPPGVPPVDLTGSPLVRSPKNTANFSVTYNRDIGEGELKVTAGYFYTSGYTNDYQGAPAGTAYPGRPGVPAGVTTREVVWLIPVKGYSLTDLDASYSWRQWEVRAYVHNLFGKKYIAAAVGSSPSALPGAYPGEPRTFGATLKRSF